MDADGYCERTGPGLLGEPLNAVTNVAFLIAAALLMRMLVRRPRPLPWSAWLLPALLGVVGLCSLSFHTFATGFTGALDSLSILVFVLTALVSLLRWMWGVRWRWAWLAVPVFVLFSVAVNVALAWVGGPDATVGGYSPALIGLLVLGIALLRTGREAAGYGWHLLAAGGVFTVSLTLRTLDEPLCADLPIGTHFLWHCLNATVLFIVGAAVVRRAADVTDTRATAATGVGA